MLGRRLLVFTHHTAKNPFQCLYRLHCETQTCDLKLRFATHEIAKERENRCGKHNKASEKFSVVAHRDTTKQGRTFCVCVCACVWESQCDTQKEERALFLPSWCVPTRSDATAALAVHACNLGLDDCEKIRFFC